MTCPQDGTPAPLEPYAATFRHIELLGQKRERLTQAQTEAEEQVLHRIAVDYKAGRITENHLCDIYVEFRECAMSGFSNRWNAAMPYMPAGRIRGLIRKREFAAIFAADSDGNWRGEYPLAWDSSRPKTGQSVVYVLYDTDNVPCYVGSTNDFNGRAKAHAREGKKFVRWLAYGCPNRASAYSLETQLLRQHKPYLNKRV